MKHTQEALEREKRSEIDQSITSIVEFDSVWGGYSITTQATLNLQTGEITNIEVSDEDGDYQHLQYEQITDLSRGVSAIVVANEEGLYFLKDLSMLVQFGGVEIFPKPILIPPRG